jgi:tetratricopeptide (TPR) repeat protein
LVQGDLLRAISVLEHALAQCHAAHVPLYVPGITASLGLAYALSGRSAEALPLLDQVQIRETPGMGGSSTMLRLGEAYLWIGHLSDAFHLAERALKLSSGRKERGSQARALRLLGEIAMHREPPAVDQAEGHYRQALGLAEECGMRPLQAHCRLGLGTLYAKTGRLEEARAELSTAITLHRAMEMTFWIPRAEAALAGVAGPGSLDRGLGSYLRSALCESAAPRVDGLQMCNYCEHRNAISVAVESSVMQHIKAVQ